MFQFLRYGLLAFALAFVAGCPGEGELCDRDASPADVAPALDGCPECICPDCPCPEGPCICKDGSCPCPCDRLECDEHGCRPVPKQRASAADDERTLSAFGQRWPRPRPAPRQPSPSPSPAPQPSGSIECPDDRLAGDVPREIRELFRNLTNPGSCVQCSLGMCGVAQNVPSATNLLWDTPYGPAELHGSWPDRVADYCRERGIPIYNVTGRSTYDWMQWATRNGRPVAIACSRAHFQTLLGYDAATQTWYVCNNNSPQKIDAYTDAQFRRLHEASAPWCVVLDAPPNPARAEYSAWWPTSA